MIRECVASRVLLGGASVVALAIAAAPSQAGIVYGFDQCVTNNKPADIGIGLAQMTVEVSPAPGNMIDFIFRNSGPAASSITDLYWADGSLLALATIFSGPGTSFGSQASPGNLPGGNNASPPFVATAGFSADSNPPVQPNGVNPGEFVTVRFSLQAGRVVSDVYDELADGTLRIGIHVQGFAGGGSESFINRTPAPGAAVLLGLGALVAGRRRR